MYVYDIQWYEEEHPGISKIFCFSKKYMKAAEDKYRWKGCDGHMWSDEYGSVILMGISLVEPIKDFPEVFNISFNGIDMDEQSADKNMFGPLSRFLDSIKYEDFNTNKQENGKYEEDSEGYLNIPEKALKELKLRALKIDIKRYSKMLQEFKALKKDIESELKI